MGSEGGGPKGGNQRKAGSKGSQNKRGQIKRELYQRGEVQRGKRGPEQRGILAWTNLTPHDPKNPHIYWGKSPLMGHIFFYCIFMQQFFFEKCDSLFSQFEIFFEKILSLNQGWHIVENDSLDNFYWFFMCQFWPKSW